MDNLYALIKLREKRVELHERNVKAARELLNHLKESLKAKTIAFSAYKEKVKIQVDTIYENMYEKTLSQNELHQRLGGVTTWYAKIKEREVELSELKDKIEKAKTNYQILKNELLKANISLEKIKAMQEEIDAKNKSLFEHKAEIELEEFKVKGTPVAHIAEDETDDYDEFFSNKEDERRDF